MPNVDVIEHVTSVSNINYAVDESTENIKKKVGNGRHKFTPFASYSDSRNLNDLSWQTANQYKGSDNLQKFTICCKEFKIQSQTYEKYQIIKMFLKVCYIDLVEFFLFYYFFLSLMKAFTFKKFKY